MHMFWTCSKLCTFWLYIFENFSGVFGKILESSPFIALLLHKHLTNLINMLIFCCLLARRLILFKWKDPNPPTHHHWIREVMSHLKMEKIRHRVRGSTGTFYNIWQPFLTFVEGMEAGNMAI